MCATHVVEVFVVLPRTIARESYLCWPCACGYRAPCHLLSLFISYVLTIFHKLNPSNSCPVSALTHGPLCVPAAVFCGAMATGG